MKKKNFLIIVVSLLSCLYAQVNVDFLKGYSCDYCRLLTDNDQYCGYLSIENGKVTVGYEGNGPKSFIQNIKTHGSVCELEIVQTWNLESFDESKPVQVVKKYSYPSCFSIFIDKTKNSNYLIVNNYHNCLTCNGIVIRDCKAYAEIGKDKDYLNLTKGMDVIFCGSDTITSKDGELIKYLKYKQNKKEYYVLSENVRLYFDDSYKIQNRQEVISYLNVNKKFFKYHEGDCLKTSFNLKLRQSENLNSDVIMVMEKGSLVRIIAIGHDDYIDGVENNWVYVQPVTFNEQMEMVNSGEDGYCYGAYLEETDLP